MTTTTEKEWEEEFDKITLPLELSTSEVWHDYIERHHDKIKALIKEIRLEAYEEGKNRAIDHIEESYIRAAPANSVTEDYRELELIMEQARELPE